MTATTQIYRRQPVSILLPEATIDRLRRLCDPDLPTMADVHRAALRKGMDAIERERARRAK